MFFEYRPYSRRFRTPLKTAHGVWTVREGVLIRVVAEGGKVAFGEVAPLPPFGTETQEAALECLVRLRTALPTQAELAELHRGFPCVASAFGMAFAKLSGTVAKPKASALNVTALLPEGFAAIERLGQLYEAGYRHFKWKIGREPVKENALFMQLLRVLPKDADLRVDANASLDYDVARQWLRYMEGRRVAWLEQPMGPGKITEMSLLAKEYSTPIALDESVCRLHEFERICQQGWSGIFVVKPSVIGAREAFEAVRAKYQPQIVYSTAFETSVGLQHLIELAASDPNAGTYPLGLGGENHFYEDALCIHPFGASMGVWGFGVAEFEKLWSTLA